MMTTILSALSDADLLANVRQAARHERDATAKLVALLAEVEARRLYLGEGYGSMFAFCTRALHMSEHAAYSRIEAARVARRFSVVLEMLADGRLSLTTIGLLAPHLTDDNSDALFDAARFQSKRDTERLIATLYPQPDIAATLRALPVASAPMLTPEADEPAAPPMTRPRELDPRIDESPVSTEVRRPLVAPLSPRRYLLRVTIGEDTQRRFERARDLLRHEIPDGDPAVIIDRALALLVAAAEHSKFAATKRPRAAGADKGTGSRSRRIPAAVRREVWARDQGRCAFIGHDGRCAETGFLEFHHLIPFATGGPGTVENLELRCGAHNRYEWDLLRPGESAKAPTDSNSVRT